MARQERSNTNKSPAALEWSSLPSLHSATSPQGPSSPSSGPCPASSSWSGLPHLVPLRWGSPSARPCPPLWSRSSRIFLMETDSTSNLVAPLLFFFQMPTGKGSPAVSCSSPPFCPAQPAALSGQQPSWASGSVPRLLLYTNRSLAGNSNINTDIQSHIYK